MTSPPAGETGRTGWNGGRAYLGAMVVLAAFAIAAIVTGEGATVALGWLGVAAIPGVVATRTWGRRVIGGLVVVTSIVALVSASSLPARGLAVGCLVIGVIVMVVGPRWPSMGTRYERSRSNTSAWQVLDSGGDPTLGGD